MPKGAVEGLRAMREANYELNQQRMRELERSQIGSKPRPMAAGKPAGKKAPAKKKSAAKNGRKRG